MNAVIAAVVFTSTGLFFGCKSSHHNLVRFHRNLESVKVGENLLDVEERLGLQTRHNGLLSRSDSPYLTFLYFVICDGYKCRISLTAKRISSNNTDDWGSGHFIFVGDLEQHVGIGPDLEQP